MIVFEVLLQILFKFVKLIYPNRNDISWREQKIMLIIESVVSRSISHIFALFLILFISAWSQFNSIQSNRKKIWEKTIAIQLQKSHMYRAKTAIAEWYSRPMKYKSNKESRETWYYLVIKFCYLNFIQSMDV